MSKLAAKIGTILRIPKIFSGKCKKNVLSYYIIAFLKEYAKICYYYCNFAGKNMARILALDYGRKRTGIAVSDSLQIIANGLTTVPTHTLLLFILDYLKKEIVEEIVIGHPKQMNNEASENLERVQAFVKTLKKHLPDMSIVYVDERFTSVLAQKTMIEAGLKKKARQNKALVDEISATIILQSYLESKRLK